MEPKNSLFNSALKSGLILGGVSVVLLILMYIADIRPVGIMMPIIILLLSIAVSIIILVVLFKKYRTGNGGFISFRDAFLYSFIALATSVIIYQLFSYLFVMVVAPDYYKNLMEAQKAWMENYLAGKMPEEKIVEQLDKIDAQAAKMNSVSTLMKNLLGSIIGSAILAIILGAILKKNPDVFDDKAGGTI